MKSILKAALILTVSALPLCADIVSFPISSDFDAEFARAADLLEAGQRDTALQVLQQIQTRSDQPAWKARIEMLLAADDERRKDFGAAAVHLAASPAAAIGLEPYRRLHLGRAHLALGQTQDGQRELSLALDEDEPFALRGQTALELARLLEKERKPADALAALARVGPGSTGSEAAEIGGERLRLARALRDTAAGHAAAGDLMLAGVDPSGGLESRRAMAQELARATPSQRARFARARIAAGDFRRALELLKTDAPSGWPPQERADDLLLMARASERLGQTRQADQIAARIPADGTEASGEARILGADLALARLHGRRSAAPLPGSPALLAVRQSLRDLLAATTSAAVRTAARERLIRVAGDRESFEEGLEQARLLAQDSPESAAGFESLWRLAWQTYLAGDFAEALSRFTSLSQIYTGVSANRRLSYWKARCLAQQGRAAEAAPVFRELASADPADLYALFSRRRAEKFETRKPPPIADPSTATATFRKTDELLRLRFFAEAAAEARVLPVSRGRDRRLAEAEFALGRFPVAALAAKRAFPEIGTAAEGRVPDPWRRLFYPIETGGFLAERAKESGLDPAILRGLVRQESVFESGARSKAGALGLTQLMPATAKSLSRSILRQRYRKAFLYDPSINARLGAAYFKRLLDQFGGNPAYALAAYNGGPTRMARVIRENPKRPVDEVFESHPAFETRDYVRRVLLFAESYRELYP